MALRGQDQRNCLCWQYIGAIPCGTVQGRSDNSHAGGPRFESVRAHHLNSFCALAPSNRAVADLDVVGH